MSTMDFINQKFGYGKVFKKIIQSQLEDLSKRYYKTSDCNYTLLYEDQDIITGGKTTYRVLIVRDDLITTDILLMKTNLRIIKKLIKRAEENVYPSEIPLIILSSKYLNKDFAIRILKESNITNSIYTIDEFVINIEINKQLYQLRINNWQDVIQNPKVLEP